MYSAMGHRGAAVKWGGGFQPPGSDLRRNRLSYRGWKPGHNAVRTMIEAISSISFRFFLGKQ